MRKRAEVEGWTDWQTMVVYSYISNDQRDQKKAQTMAQQALQQRRQGNFNLDTLANQFAQTFRKYRNQVKQQWDEEECECGRADDMDLAFEAINELNRPLL